MLVVRGDARKIFPAWGVPLTSQRDRERLHRARNLALGTISGCDVGYRNGRRRKVFIGVGNDTSNTVKGDVCKPTLHLYSCSE